MRKIFYILTRLNDEDVEWLAAVGRRQQLEVGSVLIRQGQPIEALIFVLDGQVAVTVAGIGEIARLGSGEILGEMSLVDESPPSATVTVTQPTQILAVNKQHLVARLDSDAAFAARFYCAIAMFLSIRMRNTVRRFGYGNAPVATEEELDQSLLDTVHIAGARFDRMIKELLGGDARS
jgi:CRP/FNR family transcriptional regulator, cyclic AMP receptor protein